MVMFLRFLGFYMVALCLVYLAGCTMQWRWLSIEPFTNMQSKENWSDDYVELLFSYSVEIEQIKVIHAVGMLFIAILICGMVAKKKLLSKKQYSTLLCFTCLVTMGYFFPMFAIGYKTYNLQGTGHETNAKFLADWMFMLMKNNDTNVVGLGFSCLVHM